MEKDMTTGGTVKILLVFAIPLFIGNIFQQFYSMVDSIVVGRFIGVEALAAVGCTFGFSFMVIGFAQGLTQGFAVLVSQRFGAKDERGMRKAYTQGVINCFLVTIVITVICYSLSLRMLALINTPENILHMADDYMRVIYLFLIASVMYNYFSALLRAVGDSRSPVLFLLISSLLNIVLDIILVAVIPMGVRGVAVATVISQGLSAVIAYFYIYFKYPVFRCKREEWSYDYKISKSLLRIGLPGALQFSVCAIGTIIVQASLNNFGSDSIAAYSVGIKIENLITQFFPALGMAISTFAGQNLGAGRFDRIKDGFKKATLLAIIYSFIGTLIACTLSKYFSYIFVDRRTVDPEIIREIVLYSEIASFFFIPLGFIFVFRTGSQGLGSGAIPMLSSVLELVFRVIAVMILPRLLGYLGICFASPLAWVGAGFALPFATVAYLRKIEREFTSNEVISY